MILDTLKKIEARLNASATLSDESRAVLEALLGDLRREIGSLPHERAEEAESIAAFTESSAREALRETRDPDLLDAALHGLRTSVRHVEASHPKLTEVVNGICQQLSNLGI